MAGSKFVSWFYAAGAALCLVSASSRSLAQSVPPPNLADPQVRMHVGANLYSQIKIAHLPVDAEILQRYRDRRILYDAGYKLEQLVYGRALPTVVVRAEIPAFVGGRVSNLIVCDFDMVYDPVNFPIWYVQDGSAKCRHYPYAD